MDEEKGSIEHGEGENGLLRELCPLSARLFKISSRRWVTTFHHRHGFAIDPMPFGVVDQIFN